VPVRRISCLFIVLSFLAAGVAGADSTNREEKKPDAPVVVRHLDNTKDGYKIAETAHFRIMHDQKQNVLVDKVGTLAEIARTSAHRKWFGEVTEDMGGKCLIYLHANRDQYLDQTKMKNTLGHMRTLSVSGLLSRTIHLPCKDVNDITDVLPHEVSHSVMALRFQGRAPRWADEGMAMLAESPASVQDYLGRLKRFKKKDSLFALEVLMQTEEPDHFSTVEYYAQSTSLVQFLTAEKGPQAFTAFLRTYISKGAEPSLKQHYGIGGFADLEKRWQKFAFATK
jgi:hypothetical protein